MSEAQPGKSSRERSEYMRSVIVSLILGEEMLAGLGSVGPCFCDSESLWVIHFSGCTSAGVEGRCVSWGRVTFMGHIERYLPSANAQPISAMKRFCYTTGSLRCVLQHMLSFDLGKKRVPTGAVGQSHVTKFNTIIHR